MNAENLFSIDVNLVICLAVSWFIELALGSPRFIPKPSLLIARFAKLSADRLLAFIERLKIRSAKAEKRAGVFLLIYIVLFSSIVTAVFLDLLRRLHPVFYYIFNALIISGVINTRAAADRAMSARKTLAREDTDSIRLIIADISKNCLDGVLAPMLYAALGVLLGIPAVLAAAYKTLAILDSVVGHKSGEYLYLGWASAKADDAMNFIPARLCGLLLPLLAPVCGTGAMGMARGFRATRETHAARVFSNNYISPNDAWPAAAFAGSLGIGLGGSGEAPIGDKSEVYAKEPEIEDIGKAIRLMFVASLAVLIICCAALLFL